MLAVVRMNSASEPDNNMRVSLGAPEASLLQQALTFNFAPSSALIQSPSFSALQSRKRKRKRQPIENRESDESGTEVDFTDPNDEEDLVDDGIEVDTDAENEGPGSARSRQRSDVAERKVNNKDVSFVAVKMSLESFMTPEGNLLLSFDSILVNLNLGLLDAYSLLNIHMIRLCKDGLAIPSTTHNCVHQCLIAVMINDGNVRIDPELQRLLELYKSLRDPNYLRGHRAGIKSGWQQYAVREMKTAIDNALKANFLRRFSKALRIQYGVDGTTAYALATCIIAA